VDEVAMVLGGAGIGRPMQLHLRNGEVLAGPLAWEQLVLVTEAGLKVPLAAAQLNVLFMHRDPKDGKPPSGAVVLLATHDGDRLAVAPDPPIALSAATAWGQIDVPFSEIDSLYLVREPQPVHWLVLGDHTRLSVMLRGAEMTLGTLRFGAIKVGPSSVSQIVAAKPPPDPDAEGADDEIKAPHCELAGENILVGSLEAPQLQVLTAGGAMPLDTKLIRAMEQTDEEAASVVFTFELSDGSEMTGKIPGSVLGIRARGKVWSIPTRHVVLYRQPEKPPAPGPAEGKPKDPFQLPKEKPEEKPAPAVPTPVEPPEPTLPPTAVPPTAPDDPFG
jgi:hypothetical protein